MSKLEPGPLRVYDAKYGFLIKLRLGQVAFERDDIAHRDLVPCRMRIQGYDAITWVYPPRVIPTAKGLKILLDTNKYCYISTGNQAWGTVLADLVQNREQLPTRQQVRDLIAVAKGATGE